ncbi:FAD-dependent monooxygenase [Nonomuraea roseoviolacea subsp. roseoviolacea]|uniref:2-polyprenyl-6-methoxyphenol hydroxylase-like FAD-dependent oxidoreductase n=1 Tax=Nonomuraea roseoviolacea subsp. carminata TaxID=160689 RepID=A0ABT1JUR1_9ACTN|nr:FAD-dependent monooxygenase [Nonomuraea roseoviolacea]MCP2345440.1 2-polyprenyl-6-methoxyphenol hydroxylase-like FAD-dependent oxidoreductase [Nonomuraea roseoviolacea subsp. carminata]
MKHERVPVLIVGGGYAGLSAAMLLAWRQIPVMLVERHPGTSIQPKAFGVSPRAVELLRPVPGVEHALGQIWEGIGDGMRIAIAPSLSAPNPHMIMEDQGLDFLAELTPAIQVGAPQAEIERVLRGKAEELGADLRFSTELVTLDQDGEGVTAVIRSDGVDSMVRADYVVAADGYRSPLRQALGIPTTGKGPLGHMFSIMFDADLSGLVREREVTLWYLQNDVFTGVIVTGTGVGAHVVGVNYDPDKGESAADFTPERCVELVRVATGVPDLDVRILDTASFTLAHILAERYRHGRVFLAGDAAHTMPPTGGQGGSTALQDGCDIAWRLWLVLTGQAGPGFLDTYDAERRPIGTLTADAQLANLGVRMPPAQRVDYPEPLEDYVPALLGYRYHSTAVVAEPGDDGSLLEDPRVPTGRPGGRAPHVVLDWDGQRISTIDLFASGFVLLAGPKGLAWTDAGRRVQEQLGIQLTRIRVGDELTDVEGVFGKRYGVGEGGAVLVRPDGYVAWRSPEPDPAPAATLERVLRQILSR